MASLVGAEDDRAREDALLVSRIAGGDLGEPMEELYRRYAGKLYWFGLHLLGNAGLPTNWCRNAFCGCGGPRGGSTLAVAPSRPTCS